MTSPKVIQPIHIEDVNGTVTFASAADVQNHSLAVTTTSQQPFTTTPTRCAADDVMQQQLRQILLQRKQQSYQLIQRLAENGSKPADIATIIHQLGGDMVLLAQQRPDYPANPNSLIRFEQQPRTISRQLALQLQQAVVSQNYQPIVQALQADPAPAQLAWHAQPLLTAILAADPDISLLTLQQLTDHGLQPVFADLVAATALQLPVPVVDMLNMTFVGDRQQLWFHQYRRNNLTLLAAAEGNLGLYDYWLAQGVPALISTADLNAFDLLPLPTTDTELQLRVPFIRNFVKQGLLPRQFTSLNSWLLLLPTDEALQLSEQLASTEQTAQDKRQQLDVTSLSEGIINTNQLFKQHILARHQCDQLSQLGSTLLLLDDADQNYGVALKARFRVDAEQVRLTAQRLIDQQQLEVLLGAKQWSAFIKQARQQLSAMPAAELSNYVLQQLVQHQAPTQLIMGQLFSFHRHHGLPTQATLIALQQSPDPTLQAQLRRLKWWENIKETIQLQ